MPTYEKHIFICNNHRDNNPENCCGPKGGEALQISLKEKLGKMGLSTRFRANKAGCLNACKNGITMVIYPQGIWYGHVQECDLDEIIKKSILKNEIITRLDISKTESSGIK